MTGILHIPGGKCFAHVLNEAIPDHWTDIASPFLGAGHRERKLAQRGVHVFGSDAYMPLTNTWEQLLTDPERVADLIELYAPVVTNKTTFYRIKDNVDHIKPKEHQAALFLITIHLAFNGMSDGGGYSSIRHGKFKRTLHRFVETVRSFGCPTLSVSHMDFREALFKHRDKPAFCDPPYDLPGGNHLYGVYGEEFDHESLFKILNKRDSWICCYNPSPRILGLYRSYRIFDLSGAWRYSMTKKPSSEILIVSNDIEMPNAFAPRLLRR